MSPVLCEERQTDHGRSPEGRQGRQTGQRGYGYHTQHMHYKYTRADMQTALIDEFCLDGGVVIPMGVP